MKKTGIIMLALVMLVCLFPLSVKASETEDFNTDLMSYLIQISNERGREVTKDDLEYVLNLYSESLSDFDSADGPKDFLGEVIKADYSNLTSIYEEYSLDKDSLTALLSDNGETLDDYVFLNQLDASISFYQGDGTVDQETGFEEKLTAYLSDISTIRGFTVSREMIESFLSKYEITFSMFESVDELKDFLGDVIKSDLSNLDYFNTEYSLSKEDIDSRLSTINKTLNDYVFIDDLELDILTNDDGGISYKYFMYMLEESYPGITKKLGLTEEEYTRTYQYFMSLKDYYTSEDTQNKLIDIMMRFQTLAENLPESNEAVTLNQLSELQSLYQDLQDVLKIKISYSVLENGKKVPLTLLDLMNGKDLENATISIDVYTDASEFLMDFSLSADMFGEVIGDVEKTPVTKPDSSGDKTTSTPVKTVTGGKLPKTASNYTIMILAGAFLVVLGTVLFKTNRKDGDETNAA
ncbi:processed acidic surface protein [Anaerocolumna xylanovorans]|uniref:Processed acidic surface protein n=1 Tax=Anaerocolumna xylanovorans DSM 12503 TaxID=1121345 RepID=A0A1M7YDU9_9FIRM|nr:processed acidic surface protein [Anaerocolumna xylanovorans]SHO50761.1 processed acidic surface protein [Anaerocolumna xylanovorans DSM 12503]